MAVVRVELVVGSLVVEVVVCLSRPMDPFAETVRLRDNKATEDTTQTAINNVFVFIVSILKFLDDTSNAVPADDLSCRHQIWGHAIISKTKKAIRSYCLSYEVIPWSNLPLSGIIQVFFL
jgi:hypothetical protein